jgi:prephenate dehydrogenase
LRRSDGARAAAQRSIRTVESLETGGTPTVVRTRRAIQVRPRAPNAGPRSDDSNTGDAVTAERIPADVAGARRAAAELLPERIAFLGLGLIGASIASALRAASVRSRLVAWTPSGRGPAEALRLGLIDEAASTAEAAIRGAGLVVLAGPPLAVLALVKALGGPLGATLGNATTVTDVASTKEAIVADAASHGLRFVGGHPMAGREATGVGAADADLFVGRPWVVVASARAAARDVALVEALASATGARPVHLSAAEHDAGVAAISHLPLVAAAALVEAVAGDSRPASAWATGRSLAAGGWADMTRLARGDPEMGAGILATNARNVTTELRAFRAAIDGWIDALEGPAGPDAVALTERLVAAREVLGAPESDGTER